jgi:hypothetical protein
VIAYNPNSIYIVRLDFDIGWGIVLNIVRPMKCILVLLKVKIRGSIYTHDQGLREKWFRISCNHGHKKLELCFKSLGHVT